MFQNNTHKKLNISLVSSSADLIQKLFATDILFVSGGESEYIEPYYKDLKGLKKLLINKVYAGSSMGAFMVSTNYVMSFDYQNSSIVHEGLGLLPIQLLCHWDKEKFKENKIKLLKEKSTLPVLTLNEYETVNFLY